MEFLLCNHTGLKTVHGYAWLRQVLQICFTTIIDSFTISMSKQLFLQGTPIVLQQCYCRGELLWLGGCRGAGAD